MWISDLLGLSMMRRWLNSSRTTSVKTGGGRRLWKTRFPCWGNSVLNNLLLSSCWLDHSKMLLRSQQPTVLLSPLHTLEIFSILQLYIHFLSEFALMRTVLSVKVYLYKSWFSAYLMPRNVGIVNPFYYKTVWYDSHEIPRLIFSESKYTDKP